MSGLLEDGIGLMVLGMGFVFLFLIILIFATSFMSRFLNKYFPEVAVVAAPKAVVNTVQKSSVDPEIAAVVTAAVHQHRNNNIN